VSRGPLTTTSFAILGLLAVQPWSTYELTRRMDRSLGRLWPRARSKLYEEPKKLVEQGLAEAQNMLAGAFLTEFYRMVAEWAEWAAGQVEHWPDDPAQAVPEREAFEQVVRRAEW